MCTTASAMTSTMDCRNQCTIAAPTLARGRISRGNQTLLTSWLLPTIEPMPPLIALVKNVQGSSPQIMKIANLGIAALNSTPNTNENTTICRAGLSKRPEEAQDAVLVLDLQLLADQVHQQLAVLPHVVQPLDRAGTSRDLERLERRGRPSRPRRLVLHQVVARHLRPRLRGRDDGHRDRCAGFVRRCCVVTWCTPAVGEVAHGRVDRDVRRVDATVGKGIRPILADLAGAGAVIPLGRTPANGSAGLGAHLQSSSMPTRSQVLCTVTITCRGRRHTVLER